MAGNVWEWTSTHFKNYRYNPKDGREDLGAGDGVPRVLRGGSWFDFRDFARCTYRFSVYPSGFYGSLGFRVVVSPIL